MKRLIKLKFIKNISSSALAFIDMKNVVEFCYSNYEVKFIKHILNKQLHDDANHEIKSLKQKLLKNNLLVSLSVDA